jgi:hypothetical protein
MTPTTSNRQTLPLAKAVEQKLAAQELDESQLSQLMNLQRAVLGDIDAKPARASSGRRLAVLVACAMLLLGLLLNWQSLVPGSSDYAWEIATEVVENHLKLKPLDVQASSIGEIQGFFKLLDFSPVDSNLLTSRYALAESSLLGGRYCSIKGVTAAQLRYRQSDDGLSTLYEVAYDQTTFGSIPRAELGEAPRELLIRGLKVSMWVEKGLLLVLVSDE